MRWKAVAVVLLVLALCLALYLRSERGAQSSAQRGPAASVAAGKPSDSDASHETMPVAVGDLLNALRASCHANDRAAVRQAVEGLLALGSAAFHPCLMAFCEAVVHGADEPQYPPEHWYQSELLVVTSELAGREVSLCYVALDGYPRLDERASDGRAAPPRNCTVLLSHGLTAMIVERVVDKSEMSRRARALYPKLRMAPVRAAVIRLIGQMRLAENKPFLMDILAREKDQEVVDAAAVALAALGDAEAVPEIIRRLQSLMQGGGDSPTALVTALTKLAPLRVVLPLLYDMADEDASGVTARIGSALARLADSGELAALDREDLLVEASVQTDPRRLRMLIGGFGLLAEDPAVVAIAKYHMFHTSDRLVAGAAFDALVNGGSEVEILEAAGYGLSRWPGSGWAERVGRYAHRHQESATIRAFMEQGANTGSVDRRKSFITAMQPRLYTNAQNIPNSYQAFLETLVQVEQNQEVRDHAGRVLNAMRSGEVIDPRK